MLTTAIPCPVVEEPLLEQARIPTPASNIQIARKRKEPNRFVIILFQATYTSIALLPPYLVVYVSPTKSERTRAQSTEINKAKRIKYTSRKKDAGKRGTTIPPQHCIDKTRYFTEILGRPQTRRSAKCDTINPR
jgi:hypothetical protein